LEQGRHKEAPAGDRRQGLRLSLRPGSNYPVEVEGADLEVTVGAAEPRRSGRPPDPRVHRRAVGRSVRIFEERDDAAEPKGVVAVTDEVADTKIDGSTGAPRR
jgi:hypothetical protein